MEGYFTNEPVANWVKPERFHQSAGSNMGQARTLLPISR
jgi:hypothetical protein